MMELVETWHLARYALAQIPLRRAMGVAVLNALAAEKICVMREP